MGRQVNYRSHPDDVAGLERYLASVGGMVLAQPTEQPQPVIIGNLDVDRVPPPANRFQALIAREADAHKFLYKHYPAKGWLIDKSNSPVIEYSPGYDADGVPFRRRDSRRGRMWFATSYLRDGQLVAADEDFVQWAGRVLQWVRRNWSRDDSFMYESPTAASLSDAV